MGPSLKAPSTTRGALHLASSQGKRLLRSLNLPALFCVLATITDFCLPPLFPGSLLSLRPSGVGGGVTKEPHGTQCPSWRDSQSSSRDQCAAAGLNAMELVLSVLMQVQASLYITEVGMSTSTRSWGRQREVSKL